MLPLHLLNNLTHVFWFLSCKQGRPCASDLETVQHLLCLRINYCCSSCLMEDGKCTGNVLFVLPRMEYVRINLWAFLRCASSYVSSSWKQWKRLHYMYPVVTKILSLSWSKLQTWETNFFELSKLFQYIFDDVKHIIEKKGFQLVAIGWMMNENQLSIVGT